MGISDVELFLRQNLGTYPGDALVTGLRSLRQGSAPPEASRLRERFKPYLSSSPSTSILPMDIDGDQRLHPLCDGLLLMAYQQDPSGELLTHGLLPPQTVRTLSQVHSHLTALFQPAH